MTFGGVLGVIEAVLNAAPHFTDKLERKSYKIIMRIFD